MYEDGPASSLDFELDAFNVLENAPDYDTGVNKLSELYKDKTFDDPTKANEVLSTYGNDLRHKFKTESPDFETILDIAPIKPNEVEGENTVEKIFNWEKANLDFLSTTTDPDYLISKNLLTESITRYASESRRDEFADYGEGFWAWTTDKYFRGIAGAVGPFAKLFGADELDRALIEHTQRSRDEGLVGKLAYAGGAIVPLAAATIYAPQVGIPAIAAALGIVGAQAAGEARGMYEASIEATGDKSKALQSAALVAGAQALSVIPAERAVSGLVGAFGKQIVADGAERTISGAIIKSLEAQKQTYGNLAINVVAGGLAGTGGQLLGNHAANIGLDQDGDITHGAVDAFLANAIMVGGFRGAEMFVQNTAIEQAKRTFKEADQKIAEYNAEKSKEGFPEPPPNADAYFVKDGDGHWTERPRPSETFEERVEARKQYDKAYEDYLSEEPAPYEGRATNIQGEEVDIPSFTDFETDVRPERTVLVSPKESLRPGRFMTYMYGKLGGELELSRNVANGAFGAFYPGQNKIRILRSLGADPDHFIRTLAHEGGHFIDGYLNDAFKESPSLRTVAEKLLGFKNFVTNLSEKEGLDRYTRSLSQKWRPGWDGEPGVPGSKDPVDAFRAYRNRPEEVYADTVGALLNDPQWVKDNYPFIYNAFEFGLGRNPALNSFWNQIQEFNNNPDSLAAFNLQVAKEAKQGPGVIEAARRTQEIKNNNPYAKMQRNVNLSFETFFNRLRAAKKEVSSLPEESKVEGHDLLSDISRQGFAWPTIDRKINKPLEQLWGKFLQTEIDPNMWDHMEFAKKVRDDKTLAMVKVEENPELYRKAADTIAEFLYAQKGVKPSILLDYFSKEKLATVEGLQDAFASMGIIGDTAQQIELNDFLVRYPPSDRNRVRKAQRDYALAVARLNKKKDSIPVENLRKFVAKLPDNELKTALEIVTSDGAFAARKYLVNAGGYTVYDAGRDLAYIEKTIGPEKWKMLNKISEQYHEILSSTHDVIRESQIFTPDTMARFELNKGSYVTNNVVKHFEGDDSVSASVRKAVGSLSEIGIGLNSTPLKISVVTARAYRQRAMNSAVKLAREAGHVVEEIPQKYKQDLYAERDRLSKSDKEHSYIIDYREGIPVLNKISGGKSHENMFTRHRGEWANVLLDPVEKLNKALSTRQFKTIFSPAFAINQKFYDRKLEAFYLNSFAPTILPIHFWGKARKFDKKTFAEWEHYQKTGELTGNLKTVIDLDGAALDSMTRFVNGEESGLSFNDIIYEAFGTPMPNETTYMEKAGIYTEKALNKIPGFSKLTEMVSFDELRTKVNGFQIGKEFGMSDKQAATFARERFGVPDPLGGGTAAPFINRMFLFGGAHFGGLRALGAVMRDYPKIALTQLAYRVLLPKLLVSTPIMYGLLKAYQGEDFAEAYKRTNEMIPEYHKISKNVIPLGAQDGQGNYHNMSDINPRDIQADWKAWYLMFPQSRELTSMTKVLYPLITSIFEGEAQKGLGESLEGAQSVLAGNVQPMLQYMSNIIAIFQGKNPEDFYRQKGILNKDVVAAGSLGQKFYDYSKYVASQQFPPLVPYNPFKTSEAKNIGERILYQTPVVGPLARSMIGVSNYGLIEKNKEGAAARARLDSEIKLSADDDTKELLQAYSSAAAQVSSIGKKWKTELGPNVSQKVRLLNSWHQRVWVPMRDELRAAKEAGDSERYSHILSQLEKISQSALSEYDLRASSVEPKEADQR